MGQCFLYGKGEDFTKSIIIATGPSGSDVKCQQLLRSANLVKSAEYPEASAQDASCVTLKQCDSVSKSDRVQITLDVTASTETKGYWAPESGLISEKREITLKSGKQTIKLDVVSAGALSLDTKFFCKSGSDEATITAENLQIKKITPGKEKIVSEKSGTWTYRNIDIGLWAIQASLEGQEATNEIEVPEFGVYRVTITYTYRVTPEFTYTGDYEVVDDDNRPIEDFAGWKNNWKIRFLTSGIFTVTKMHGWNGRIDLFIVSGGGGGCAGISGQYTNGGAGGAGYTLTEKNIFVEEGIPYQIDIGSGGAERTKGGTSSAFTKTITGGTGASNQTGAPGGSGGGAGRGGKGGSDGSDGGKGTEGEAGGKGQGSTTKEFGEENGTLYAGGGGGVGASAGAGGGKDNTGGGGNGSRYGGTGGRGYSGIVIIRNARAA